MLVSYASIIAGVTSCAKQTGDAPPSLLYALLLPQRRPFRMTLYGHGHAPRYDAIDAAMTASRTCASVIGCAPTLESGAATKISIASQGARIAAPRL